MTLEQMGRNNTYKKYIKIFTKHHKGDEWKKAVEKSVSGIPIRIVAEMNGGTGISQMIRHKASCGSVL